MRLDRTARRVLGCLLEKRWTTPDQFPLSLNALVSGCNQRSNRDPVLTLEEFEISGCLLQLRTRGLVIVHERDFGRVPRYSDRLAEEWNLERDALAILAELMLRGPQAPGELLRRCKRMAHYPGPERIFELLRRLAALHFVKELPRGSRERYARWTHLLAPKDEGEVAEEPEDDDEEAPRQAAPATVAAAAPASSPAPPAGPAPTEDISDLRAELTALRDEIAVLRERVETLEGLV